MALSVRLAERSITEPGANLEAYYTFTFVVEEEDGTEVSRHPAHVATSANLTQERLQAFVDRARARMEARIAAASRIDLEAIQ